MSSTVRFSDGDFEFGTAGDQTLVAGAEKAAQDLLDEVLLPYDAIRDRGNEMFTADGSMMAIVSNGFMGENFVKSSIQSATRRLMRAQSRDRGTTRNEVIQGVKTLLVQQQDNDPTSYAFFLAVVVNDENIAVARAISMGHLGNTPTPLVGGSDQ
jgi:hypothetical protein